MHASSAERTTALREVRRVLSQFPGVPSFWWLAYRLAEDGGDMKAAWDALSRARLLAPDNSRFMATSLILAVRALPAGEADAHIARVRSSLERAGAEVCLMYAHAEIELARRDHAQERWRRAREATSVGLVQARSEGLRKNLHATQLILDSLLAGKDPTLDVLYLAGLGEILATAPPKSSAIDIVARMAKKRVSVMDTHDPRAA